MWVEIVRHPFFGRNAPDVLAGFKELKFQPGWHSEYAVDQPIELDTRLFLAFAFDLNLISSAALRRHHANARRIR